MNYFLSRFACFVNNKEIVKDVKYKIKNMASNYLFFGKNNEMPICVNFLTSDTVLKIEYNTKNYFVVYPTNICHSLFFKITFLNVNYYITVSSKIVICTDKENILEAEVKNVSFSHYDIMGNVLLIYFVGKRNFVVIIQSNSIKAATYYDEFNQTENEKLFMCKLKDSLNHGKVYKIKNNVFEKYLVYLDNYEQKLKPRFLCFTFLDCLLAENFKYCNELLVEDIKQSEAENIKNFFPMFDFYFELEINVFALIKKDTLAGIFKFETNNLKITNIIPVGLQHF